MLLAFPKAPAAGAGLPEKLSFSSFFMKKIASMCKDAKILSSKPGSKYKNSLSVSELLLFLKTS